jgi:HlyD family secretion protein
MKWGIRIAGLVVLAAVAVFVWWFTHRERPLQELTLYGNVDLREVDLAFNNNERIFRVLVTEGDRVHRGQILARVDTSRLAPQVAQAEANLALDSVNLANARDQYQRNLTLSRNSGGRGIARQDVDNTKAAFDAQGARRQADAAQLALLRQELADSVLVSPADATVRTRIMEPGEMASPTRPVFSLALTDPKWVRVYVSETDLGKLHPGMAATISVDAFPGNRFPGWIGFISPTAEFTPKSVETEDLRTSLVYEVRVFVKDPADALRLGMPATAHVSLARFAAEAQPNSRP